MKKYKVYIDRSLTHLELSVESAISQGWSLVGGISITHTSLDRNDAPSHTGEPMILYAQAVAR